LRPDFSGDPVISALNLGKEGHIRDTCSFTWMDERNSAVEFSDPLTFLYEPNAAILKAGGFKWVAHNFKVKKLAPNSHLYTSNHHLDFPGRVFRVMDHVKPDKKLKERFPGGCVNILIRNYPLSVEEIKKKTGLNEGGEQYLIATQSEKEKHVLIAERIQ
jgi:hypothetical protein